MEEEKEERGKNEVSLKIPIIGVPVGKIPATMKDIAGTLILKGTGFSKALADALFKALRTELRAFFRTINLSDEIRRVLTDISVEFKVEVTFRDRREERGGGGDRK